MLKEIIEYFRNEGIDVVTTARDFAGTLGLCDFLGVDFERVGEREENRNKYSKMAGVIRRGFALKNFLKRKGIKPDLAVSHGSRSQGFASYLMGTKAVSLDDYEFSFRGFNRFVENILTPFPIKPECWGKYDKKVVNYPGLKEELYLWNKENYLTDDTELFNENKINVIFRPESPYTHYASDKSKLLQDEVVNLFMKQKDLNVILFARNNTQEEEFKSLFTENGVSVKIPKGAINGPSLIYKSDAVFSGGGTMAREACVLGTLSYSFFGGELGNVDKYLIEEKKMVHLESVEDVSKIVLDKKSSRRNIEVDKKAFEFVSHFLEEKL